MSHPPKDGETFDTVCTAVEQKAEGGGIAICEGGGLSATADNDNGFFQAGARYVWYVRTAAPDDTAGDAGQPQSGG